jgi:hypothetical protein
MAGVLFGRANLTIVGLTIANSESIENKQMQNNIML